MSSAQGSRRWNTPYLSAESKFPRKALPGNSLWESNHKLGERESLARWLHLLMELSAMLPLSYSTSGGMRPNCRRNGSPSKLGKQCLAGGLWGLWPDSVSTKSAKGRSCFWQDVWILFSSQQEGHGRILSWEWHKPILLLGAQQLQYVLRNASVFLNQILHSVCS